MKKLILIATIVVLAASPSFAQGTSGQARIDSLLSALPQAKADSVKIFILNQIAMGYGGIKPDEGVKYAQQSVKIAEGLGDKRWLGSAYNVLGNAWNEASNFPEALKNHFAALKIRKELGLKKAMGGSYCNIGNCYRSLANYPEALKYYFEGMKVLEEIKDKKFLANTYYGIAVTYMNLNKYSTAMEYHLKAMKIRKDMGDMQQVAYSYTCIGDAYRAMVNYPKAMENYQAALKIQNEENDMAGIMFTRMTIGALYKLEKKYPQALENLAAALKLGLQMNDQYFLCDIYLERGAVHHSLQNYREAEKCYIQCIGIAKKIGNLNTLQIAAADLSEIYRSTGQLAKALDMYKQSVAAKDSMVNAGNIKKVVELEMQYNFDKKEAAAKTVQEKKDILTNESFKKQRLIRNGLSGGFLVVVLFSLVVFRQRVRVTKEKNKSDELLLNILPHEVANELKESGTAKAHHFDKVTVLFTDFVDFTNASERLTPQELVDELHACFHAFDNIISKHGIEKIKTVGDAYLAVAGLPTANPMHAHNLVKAALEIRDFVARRKLEKGDGTFEIRIGLNSGNVVAGIVGVKKFAYDIWGDTVNLAARMEQHSEPGKINISASTYELVKDSFVCTHRGRIQAKNKGEIDMYFVESEIKELNSAG